MGATVGEPKRWYWHVDVSTSKAAMLRCFRAVIHARARMTDSGKVGDRIMLCLQVPDGAEVEFRRTCKPLRMAPPPGPQDCYELVDDGHPGRKPGVLDEGAPTTLDDLRDALDRAEKAEARNERLLEHLREAEAQRDRYRGRCERLAVRLGRPDEETTDA